VERATRIASSPLGKSPLDFELVWSPPAPPRLSGADPASLQAALRLVHQFLETDDKVAFPVLAKRLPEDDELSPRFLRDLPKIFRRLESALDQAPAMRAQVRGHKAPAHRVVLEAFFDASLEGLKPADQQALEVWLSQPASALLIRAQLQSALGAALEAIRQLRKLCERELLDAAR